VALPPKLSKDNYEIQFGINHLAHFLITTTLLPFLQAAASCPNSDVRIITTTSLGFRFGVISPPVYKDLTTTCNSYMMGPWVRYGRSKYANVLMAHHLAKLYPNITSVSVHPGVTDTELVSNTRYRDRFLIWSTNLGARYFTSEEGALNQLWMASGMEKGKVRNGGLYLPVGVDGEGQTSDVKDMDGKAKELWEWSVKAVEKVVGKL
jgi:NAD(P)-dependent dehydrogenase (short-subunit alcohol dehydrogenase family)